MSVRKKLAEAKEVEKAEELAEEKNKDAGVAAFFDLDGTLVCLPSLEKRFFLMLRYRKLIGLRNYFLWFVETLRLLRRGINRVMHANKMYLRGLCVRGGGLVRVRLSARDETRSNRCELKRKHDEKRRQAGMPVPFFSEAIERVVWHVERGHSLVIVSGTLEPLAERAADAVRAELGARGLACAIRVCATRLEEENERWTGRIVGDAMFGEAKAREVRRIAADENLDLQRCFAYGDSASDKWMLECVGKPAAVNPSNDLARIARQNEWLVLRWGKGKAFRQSALTTKRSREEDAAGDEIQFVRKEAESRT